MDVCAAKPLPTYDDALALILSHAQPTDHESVALAEALGRTLQQSITADRDQPPFNRSAMDGFAVRSDLIGTKESWPIHGSIKAGADPATFQTPVPDGMVMRIATGAPLPVGADATIPIELANVNAEDQSVQFTIDECQSGQNIHARASDCNAGQTILQPGIKLGPQQIGLIAAMGHTAVTAARRPRVTVLTTGDEVRPSDTPLSELQPQQIRNSNGPMLVALLKTLGAEILSHQHLPDEHDLIEQAGEKALNTSDLVVTVGGVSVGQRDLLPDTWPKLGCETVLHGVGIQPGKPLLSAISKRNDHATLVVGLPGNPVSALATSHLFIGPIITTMLRGKPSGASWREVQLTDPVKAKSSRQVFRAARANSDGSATVIKWHGSGDLVHTADADGLVRLPLTDEPVQAGTVVPYLSIVGA